MCVNSHKWPKIYSSANSIESNWILTSFKFNLIHVWTHSSVTLFKCDLTQVWPQSGVKSLKCYLTQVWPHSGVSAISLKCDLTQVWTHWSVYALKYEITQVWTHSVVKLSQVRSQLVEKLWRYQSETWIWPDFCKFFGLQRAKIGPIFLKINKVLSLAPMSDIPRLEVNRLRNFDFIGRKLQFGQIFVSFSASRGPKLGRFS